MEDPNKIGTYEFKDIVFIGKDERTGRPRIKLVDINGQQAGEPLILEQLLKFAYPDSVTLDIEKIKLLMGE